MHIITGSMNAEDVLAKAREKHVSVTEYLTAVMILSVDAIQRRRVPQETATSRSRYRFPSICGTSSTVKPFVTLPTTSIPVSIRGLANIRSTKRSTSFIILWRWKSQRNC